MHASDFSVRASAFSVHASDFSVRASEFSVHASEFSVHASGFSAHVSGFSAHVSEFSVRASKKCDRATKKGQLERILSVRRRPGSRERRSTCYCWQELTTESPSHRAKRVSVRRSGAKRRVRIARAVKTRRVRSGAFRCRGSRYPGVGPTASAHSAELDGLIGVDTLARTSRFMPLQILRALCWSVPRAAFSAAHKK